MNIDHFTRQYMHLVNRVYFCPTPRCSDCIIYKYQNYGFRTSGCANINLKELLHNYLKDHPDVSTDRLSRRLFPELL